MDAQGKKYIEKFLDEFMWIEYRGKDHIVARAHYRDVFNQILPKYIRLENETQKGSTKEIEKTKIKNIDE